MFIRLAIDVRKKNIQNHPLGYPKHFYFKMIFFNVAPKVTKYLGCFCQQMCCQDLSKIAQSVPTIYTLSWSVPHNVMFSKTTYSLIDLVCYCLNLSWSFTMENILCISYPILSCLSYPLVQVPKIKEKRPKMSRRYYKQFSMLSTPKL